MQLWDIATVLIILQQRLHYFIETFVSGKIKPLSYFVLVFVAYTIIFHLFRFKIWILLDMDLNELTSHKTNKLLLRAYRKCGRKGGQMHFSGHLDITDRNLTESADAMLQIQTGHYLPCLQTQEHDCFPI